MKVINLFGGPGTGKSTIAAQLFVDLKILQLNCELVTEFAKDLTYDESIRVMDNQIWIFANQHQRMYRLQDKVDYLVTDAPLFNSIIYSGKGDDHKSFHNFVLHEFNRYDNLNVFIERSTDYRQEGRYQNEREAIDVDNEVLRCFNYFEVPFVKVELKTAVSSITNLI